MFNRRFFFGLAAALPGAGLLVKTATKANAANEKAKVVYHVSDGDKVGFVLGNIKNHINGVGGPENIEIVLVAHGPAVKMLNTISGDQSIIQNMTGLMGQKVQLHICANTLKALKTELSDLPEGAKLAEKGGVVRIADLQQQGYLYIRP
ncbi:MAG: DsrE family protein [Hyphomicrobiaceae bacterium]|nr:DsrE family protein [Hyphomicrobiaceae bacterium]